MQRLNEAISYICHWLAARPNEDLQEHPGPCESRPSIGLGKYVRK